MPMIDSNELKEWVKNWFEKHHYYHPHSKANDIPITELYDLLEQMPTVDAVPVVRCRECKWYDRKTSECHNPRYGNGWANYPPPSVNDDYYCADGERKGGADDGNKAQRYL